MESLAPIFAATGGVGLLAAAGTLVIQLIREANRLREERVDEIKDLKVDMKALKDENSALRADGYACRLQVNSLVMLLREGGIALPEWLVRHEN